MHVDLEALGPVEGQWAVILAALLTASTFAVAISEKLQKLIGPIGKWLSTRQHRSIEDQMAVEEIMQARHNKQISAVMAEAEFYRKRYEELIKKLEDEED